MSNFFSNLYNKLFGKSKMKIIILGLDGGAGKTTVLYRIKEGTTINTCHTVGFNFETVEHNNASYEVWDFGGADKIRPLWKHYLLFTNGVIFVIDSTDRERLETVEFEVNRLLKEDELENCPLLLLANKQDLPNAVSVDELKVALKLDQWKHRNVHILPAVASQGTGLTEGFEWLCKEMTRTTQ